MHRRQRVYASGLSSRNLLLTIAAALVLAATAHADVTMKEKSVSSGLAGFGGGTSERTVVIAGDKSRTDDEHTYTGRFQSLAGGGKPRTSTSITRLDRELIWTLDPQKKTYIEMTFAEMRAAMEKGAAQMQAEMAKPENAKAKDLEMDFKVDVKRTGKRDKVNGFNAEEFIVTLTATPKDKSTGQAAGDYTMSMDQWLSTEVPGQAEIQAYYRRFAEKMGMDPQMQNMMGGMARQYGAGLKQMAEKMKEMKGYPVRSTMTMNMGVTLTPEQQAQMDKARADAEKARAENAGKKDEKEDAEASGGAASALAHGNLGGALGGFLGHKAGKAAEHKAGASMASGAGSGGASNGGLTVTTDVLSISTGSSGTSFDVPSDFKKVERRH